VVIGGGVMGASALFHLAEAGVDNAVLVERGQLACGSTSRAAGGVRAQFSDALNIEIAQRSLRAFRDFGRRPGWEIDLHEVGYLFLLDRTQDVDAFTASIALQREYGVPSRVLTPTEAKSLNPLIETDGLLASAFSPEDGYVTPEAVVQGYAAAARSLGANVVVGCEVQDIETRGDEIAAVRTNRGVIETPAVICAAGAWSSAIAAMVGVDLPVTPLRRQILFTEPLADLPARLPMTIDFGTTFYFHREGPGLLMGMSWPGERPGFNVEVTDDWIPDLLAAIERRAPRIAQAGIRTGWAGLYEVSPDHNAMIGEARSPSRFLYATGFSGHGFLQGPAVGEIMRDLLLGRAPFVDVTPLTSERFARGSERPELNIV
jgi:sarcosine oxidase, subunit beta